MSLPSRVAPAVAVSGGPDALSLLQQAPMRCGGCGSKVRSITNATLESTVNVANCHT